MNTYAKHLKRGAIVVAGMFLLAACATPQAPEAPLNARLKLDSLQADSQLATRAPRELEEARIAVEAAEAADADEGSVRGRHLIVMADQKVEIARARAQSRLYEDQRRALSEESERARLQARTLEADRSRREAEAAREEARSAQRALSSAEADAAMAREEAAAARQERLELERRIQELDARETDRGLVVTLGDVLFATGQAELQGSAIPNLNKLAAFLQEYDERTVHVEGHTDSVGSAEFNQQLSERRAESVKAFLVGRGIDPRRISIAGLGKSSPVASNDTPTGRQQNRRVEVVISNDERVSTRRERG
jgi:outer membrane protein OmpA-like peptidoglycan-associated protein